jgi:WD40 repeat protein
MSRWLAGSGFLIGRRLVLTAAHTVDYRQELADDARLLVRTIEGSELTARVVLVCDELSQVDLALLEISDPGFTEQLAPVIYARIDRDSPVPVSGCWAVGFPWFGEASHVLPQGSRRETWQVRGEILPGAKRRAGLLSLQITTPPQPIPAALGGSPWEGMSGAVVFATDPQGGEQAVGVITMHHPPEGAAALTISPISALAGLLTARDWWRHLEVRALEALPVLPPEPLSAGGQLRSRLAGPQALKEHWDPRARGVERAARPGWFFSGRREALSQLVTWLTDEQDPADNVRVVTGGPGSGKSAVLARLVTMSDSRYLAEMPRPLRDDDPVADLPPGAIDVAVHARAAPTDEIVGALAAAARASQSDLDGLIDRLLERPDVFTIAVDALDEADDPRTLALALRRVAGEAADAGVRLLVGTRPGGPEKRLINALGLSPWSDPRLIDLDTSDYLSRDDLSEYVYRRLLLADIPPGPGRPDTPYRGKEKLAWKVARAVAEAAYPTFLIGQLVSRALVSHKQPISPNDPGWQRFPTSVAEAMDRYLASLGGQAEQDRIEDLLRPLAYARGDGLPLDEAGLWPRLATALARPGRSYTLSDVATLLDTAADYLIETVVASQAAYYRLYHQALSDRLREIDQQRPRAVGAAQTVYGCLLDTVARHPPGRSWEAAHPYLRSQLAGYAADVGELASLLDDPGFLVAADPVELFAALQRPGQPTTDQAQIYRHAYPHLFRDAETAAERASYLQLAARRLDTRLADQFDQLPLHQSWGVRWIRGPRPQPHYIVDRHSAEVSAMAVSARQGRAVIVSGGGDGTIRVCDFETGATVVRPFTGHPGGVNAMTAGERRGRAVIVSGGGDGTIRVWDLETGEPALDPLTGHDGQVSSVAIGARQGRAVIVSGGGDGTIRVWDLETGEPGLAPLTGHDGQVSGVAAGEQEGWPVVVSGGGDGTIRVWDLESGDTLTPFTGHAGGVTAVAIGERHGRPVIISGGGDGTIQVCDLETGATVLSPLTGHTGGVTAVAIGERHGRPVVVSGDGDGTVRVWDLETDKPELAPLTGHVGGVSAVAAGERQGRAVLVSGDGRGTVRVWDLETGELALDPLTGHASGVSVVTLGERHGRAVIVSGGGDGTIRVWDLETGEPALEPLTGHDGQVSAVAAGEQDGRPVIMSGGGDGTIRVWDLESGDALSRFTGHAGGVGTVAVGERQGRPVIVSGGGDGTVRVWDVEARVTVLGPFTGHASGVTAVTLGQRHGRPLIVSGGGDGTIRMWDLGTGDPVLDPVTGHDPVQAVVLSKRHNRPVIISGCGGMVRVQDLGTGEPVLHSLTGHNGRVSAVAVGLQDGRPVIMSGGDDGTVRLWDLESGDALTSLTGHGGGVSAVAVGEQDGRPVVVSGGGDGMVRVWDLETGESALDPLAGHDGGVSAVAAGARHGRPVVVSGGGDGTVRARDLESGDTLTLFTGHEGGVSAVAVGEQDGRPVVVSGGGDGTVGVWDLESGDALTLLAGHEGGVSAVAVGERQSRAVVVSGDGAGTVRVWDLETDKPVLNLFAGHEGGVSAVAVGERHGRPTIISGGGDGTVRVWDLETGEPTLDPLTGHAGVVSAVVLGERRSRPVIVFGRMDWVVGIWDFETKERATSRIELENPVLSVASNADVLVISTTTELLRVDLF